jgi:hypothetical protein
VAERLVGARRRDACAHSAARSAPFPKSIAATAHGVASVGSGPPFARAALSVPEGLLLPERGSAGPRRSAPQGGTRRPYLSRRGRRGAGACERPMRRSCGQPSSVGRVGEPSAYPAPCFALRAYLMCAVVADWLAPPAAGRQKGLGDSLRARLTSFPGALPALEPFAAKARLQRCRSRHREPGRAPVERALGPGPGQGRHPSWGQRPRRTGRGLVALRML